MNSIRRLALSLLAVLLFSGLAMTSAVSAHAGHAHGLDKSSLLAERFRAGANQLYEKNKTLHSEHTQAQRQKACTARKANLARRMSNAVAQAKRHQAVFDKIYSRVKDFYAAKKLDVADYTALTAKADAAQSDSQAGIDALSALDVNIDCTSQTVVTSVSAFREAVRNARDSIKTYRTALVDLINSLKGASTGTDSSNNTGGTQ